jgi:hypothetical protein
MAMAKDGKFSVKSLYKQLWSNEVDGSFRHPWKSKIPLKIKVWQWLIWHNAIPRKDNMLKRNWTKTLFVNSAMILNRSYTSSLHACPATKYVWSVVGLAIGARTRPGSFAQYFGCHNSPELAAMFKLLV